MTVQREIELTDFELSLNKMKLSNNPIKHLSEQYN